VLKSSKAEFENHGFQEFWISRILDFEDFENHGFPELWILKVEILDFEDFESRNYGF
jgi:hypothetical protein